MANPQADGRMINRAIADSDKFAALSPEAAVLFTMLIPWFNAHGKMNGGAGHIKDEICPKISYLTYENIPDLLKEISEKTSVKWFKDGGRYWIHSLHFNTEHQNLKKQGTDKLPSYSPELVPDKSETSPELVQIKSPLKDKDKNKDKAKGSPELVPPVDNSTQKPEIKSEPVPEPQKEKNAFFEKRNKEFSEVMAKIKAKYDYKEQQEIENWIKANYRGKHPDALIHTLNSIVHPVRPGKPDISISLYLDKVIALENQNYNAADYDKQAAEFKKPGLFSMSDIFAGMKLHAGAGG